MTTLLRLSLAAFGFAAIFTAADNVVATGAGAEAAEAPATTVSTMTLTVDETQAARRIAFVHEEIAVRPGSLTLAYPRWIPGEHGPTGPIQQFAALRIRSGNDLLRWTRDPDDIYTIHVDVPADADRITVDFDTLLENTISDRQLLLAWNTVVLYPRAIDKRTLMIEPSILLPSDWKQGSSLAVASQSGARVNFAPVSLERLIDSPVLAGEFFRTVPLTSKWPAVLDITGDSQSAVDRADEAQAFSLFGKLIDQDRAMFGFRHWQTMHLLISQSEARRFDGLEHADSPYTGAGDAALSKKDQLERFGWPLFVHEQSHSWIGKYRRPAELYSKSDYQGPEQTSLLWVYEGLNEYAGMVLASRAGFNDANYIRELLAIQAAGYAHAAGRAATALVDTATETWVLRSVDRGWSSLRRGQDYYDEGALIWLSVDAILREQSKGRLSLDDFLRSFFGQRDTGPIVVPYTREDVEAALSAVLPFDWHSFFEARVYQVNARPPTEGLEASGWRLVYNETPNRESFLNGPGRNDARYSIGASVRKDGTIADVLPGTPAYDAGLGPRMAIVAVDGHAYSPEWLNQSIAHPRNGTIVLVVRNFDSVETREVRYAGGIRFPHLERIPGSQDHLTQILAPRND